MGRADEALEQIRRAQELDPLSPIINAITGEKLASAGKEDLAIDALNEQIAVDPSFAMAHLKLGEVYLRKRKLPEAIAEFETAHRLEGNGSYAFEELGIAYGRAGKTNEAQRALSQLLELQRQGLDHRIPIALIQHVLGDDTLALESLEQAVTEMADGLEGLYADPAWKDLRPHPRFQAILKRMNFVK